MSEIMPLEDQVYIIAKHYIANLANDTLLRENWTHSDFDRRYLAYAKDYTGIRKVIESGKISSSKLKLGLDSLSQERASKTNTFLTDLLIEKIKLDFELDRNLILEIEKRLTPFRNFPISTDLIKEMRKILEDIQEGRMNNETK